MGTILNSNIFKGVSVGGQIVKGLAKNGVVFWKLFPTDYILAYSFNGNTADASVNGLNGAMTGYVAFDAGRKVGTQSMKFTNGCVKTILPLPVNSDKVSISFWMKTTQKTTSTMIELSSVYINVKGFAVFLNDLREGKIEVGSGNLAERKFVDSSNNVNSGAWMHIVGVIDRAVTPTLVKIYVNRVDVTTLTSLNSNNTGNFANNILFIGQRNASSLPFVGNLQDLKIYNRVLSEDEITTLYNE